MGVFSFFKKDRYLDIPDNISVEEERGILLQPIDGEIIPLSDIGDGIFSEGVLGNGCGLIPSGEAVYAPVSGVVATVAESKHAVGIEADGVEMLIHVGLETVSMNGKGFDVRVQEGDEVKAGQLLLTFSLSEIEKVDGVKTTSAIVVNNSDELPVFEVLRTGQGKAGSRLFKVK